MGLEKMDRRKWIEAIVACIGLFLAASVTAITILSVI